MKVKQLKQDILNQYESIGFPKLLSRTLILVSCQLVAVE